MSLLARAKTATENDGFTLTDSAAAHIKKILADNGLGEGAYLCVGVRGGGCSGLQYALDLRDEKDAPVSADDEVFVSQDIVVVADLKSYVVGNLGGTVIDYEEGLMGSGFRFRNPNARHECGCGKSYSA